MITQEEFTKLISDNLTHNKRIDEVEAAIKWSIFDWDIVEYGNVLFDFTLSILFEPEAVDDILWWVYERRINPELKMWDENGNEIPTETIEDLWNIVKDFRKQ
jgi:hypothetical protein|nr:MAG TPA: hypothetical protein [Caudoviricetes sp.]